MWLDFSGQNDYSMSNCYALFISSKYKGNECGTALLGTS